MAAPKLARAGVERMDLIGASWGGVVASIGLLAGSGRDLPLRLGIVAIAFAAGGFLSGIRANARRLRHALVAFVVAYAIYAAFIGLAHLIHGAGGPEPPDLIPADDGQQALMALGWSAAFMLIGTWLASMLLGGDGRRRRRRRR